MQEFCIGIAMLAALFPRNFLCLQHANSVEFR